MLDNIKGNFPHFTQRNSIVIGCCIAVVLMSFFLGPILQEKKKNSLDMKIADKLEEAQALKSAAELRQLLQDRIVRLQPAKGPVSFTGKALPSDQVDQVLAEMRRLAVQAGVKLVSFQPILESMGQSSKSMQIGATYFGRMEAFQDMLDSLLQLPYVESLQGMLLSSEAEGLQLEIDFSVQVQ